MKPILGSKEKVHLTPENQVQQENTALAHSN